MAMAPRRRIPPGKPVAWLVDVWKAPPMSREAAIEAGYLLRKVQQGKRLTMPDSLPFPDIGKRCHELRIKDGEKKTWWRIAYRTDKDAVVVIHWFEKKSNRTPKREIETCKARLRSYDEEDD